MSSFVVVTDITTLNVDLPTLSKRNDVQMTQDPAEREHQLTDSAPQSFSLQFSYNNTYANSGDACSLVLLQQIWEFLVFAFIALRFLVYSRFRRF